MKISCLESCLTQRKKTTRKGSDGLKATRPEKVHTSASTGQWCRMLSCREQSAETARGEIRVTIKVWNSFI